MDDNDFSEATELTNVVLLVDDEELHVCKEFLATHSPVFYEMFFGESADREQEEVELEDIDYGYLATHSPVFQRMFFGAFAENGKEEVEMNDVDYDEFVDLLNVIHPGRFDITADSVSHILKLADQFEIKDARDQAELFLMTSDHMDKALKLQLADQYTMTDLMDACLNSFKCINDRRVLKSFSDYELFSVDLKAAICDKMIGLLSESEHNKFDCACRHDSSHSEMRQQSAPQSARPDSGFRGFYPPARDNEAWSFM